jgi:hemolysin-activating ACP:hemolysin acyltransferase
MSSNFNCSYMARSSLTYIPDFSVKFFFQPIYTDYANWSYFDKRSHLNLLLWNRWTKLNQTWQGWEEISIFSNSSHLEWRAGLSDTNLKGTHPGSTPARFGLIWFSGFRGEDLNVIFYQNMTNLHNRYKSAERKISQKNPDYMLKYCLTLTYIPDFSVKFSFQPIYTDYANWAYFDKRSHLNLLLWNRRTKLNQTWQGWTQDGSLSNLCLTAPPFIQDGCCY